MREGLLEPADAEVPPDSGSEYSPSDSLLGCLGLTGTWTGNVGGLDEGPTDAAGGDMWREMAIDGSRACDLSYQ